MPAKLPATSFVTSSPDIGSCPPPSLPEFALIGRSNVGKSTLLNLLASQKALAKVSATPGRTRLINFFLINNAYFLVDLPGYGFAKAGKKDRSNLESAISGYLLERPSLYNTLVLIDSRLPPQKIDLEFVAWLAEIARPFSLVFTKTDKLNAAPAAKNRADFLAAIAPNEPQVFATSSVKKTGVGELRAFLSSAAKAPAPPPREE